VAYPEGVTVITAVPLPVQQTTQDTVAWLEQSILPIDACADWPEPSTAFPETLIVAATLVAAGIDGMAAYTGLAGHPESSNMGQVTPITAVMVKHLPSYIVEPFAGLVILADSIGNGISASAEEPERNAEKGKTLKASTSARMKIIPKRSLRFISFPPRYE